jgi:hypothetical protein
MIDELEFNLVCLARNVQLSPWLHRKVECLLSAEGSKILGFKQEINTSFVSIDTAGTVATILLLEIQIRTKGAQFIY